MGSDSIKARHRAKKTVRKVRFYEGFHFSALGEIEWVKPLRPGRFPGQILGEATLTRA